MDRVLANLDRWEQNLRDHLESRLVAVMLELEAEAKATHPYMDQTGELTASIQGFVRQVTDDVITGELTATALHANYVETMQDGKYAFLWPVIERNQDKILAALAR